MGDLVRLKLRPLGVWTTPWQADSLLGSLASVWARFEGVDALRRDFLDPWLANEPPFVLSDAFPGDWLPAPANLPLMNWAPEEYKTVKKTAWLSSESFGQAQRGRAPALGNTNSPPIEDRFKLRNSISRASDASADTGGLFDALYSELGDSAGGRLTLYARAAPAGLDLLTRALETLGRIGYGARASVGHGAFELDGGPAPCSDLDDVPGADGFVSLSTFQPARTDPVDGCWRSFVKYGKMAPEFHSLDAVFKRPQAMLRAGACFRTDGPPRPFYGVPIGADRLLSDKDREELAARGVHPVQAAFALAVPMAWPNIRMESDR